MQSSINVKRAIFAVFPLDYLRFNWSETASGFPTREHGVRIDFECDPESVLLLDEVPYVLRQFHFHHPSEHFVEDRQSAVELHIVNQNLDDLTFAVVAVMIDLLEQTEKPKGNQAKQVKAIQEFVRSLRQPMKADGELPAWVSTNPRSWLPSNPNEYYRYEGSLTTEPFTETVSWAILREQILLPKDLLGELIACLRHSARALQPLYRRYVLRNFDQ